MPQKPRINRVEIKRGCRLAIAIPCVEMHGNNLVQMWGRQSSRSSRPDKLYDELKSQHTSLVPLGNVSL